MFSFQKLLSFIRITRITRVSFFIPLMVFLSLPVFAKTGVLSGSKGKLQLIKTQYFDIVYPSSCASSAEKIADVCDDMYLEICAELKTESYQRFPVTITNQVESLNAYFTSYPNNRIVLYDTPPETTLDMYGDTLTRVFYHELTHAVTFNIKSSSMRIMSTLFTPAMALQNVTLTSFWSEGAAVFMESRKGEGRLNDPFSLMMAYQSQKEGKKISWRDVTGARDTFPGGNDAYIFGAMFTQFLVDKYGEEKYAEFWKKAGSKLPISLVAGIFEDTYGELITTVWKEFLESIKVEAKSIEDIGAEKISFDSYKGKKRLTALDSVGNTLVYADSSRTGVFVSKFDGEKYGKAKKILSIGAVESLKISSDEKKLFIEHYTTRANTKSETVVFDLEKNRVLSTALYGTDSKKGEGGELYFNECNAVEFAGEMVKPKIVKRGMNWAIRLEGEDGYAADFSADGSFSNDSGIIIHDLHIASATSDKLELLFTFAPIGREKVYPRLALASIEVGEDGKFKAVMRAAKDGFSGGVFNPSPQADYADDNRKIFYTAEFYDHHEIFTLDFDALETDEIALIASTPEDSIAALEKEKLLKGTDEKKYTSQPFGAKKSLAMYFKNHAIMPGTAASFYSRKGELDNDIGLYGFTFIGADYWGGNTIGISGGYDFSHKIGGGNFQIAGGNDAVKYSLSSTVASQDGSFMQTSHSAELSLLLFSRFVHTLGAGVGGLYVYGHENTIDLDEDATLEQSLPFKSHYAEQLSYLKYSNIHKVGSRYEMKAGFSLTPFLRGEYFYSDDYLGWDLTQKAKYLNAGATLALRIPFIAPLSLTASLFPSSEYFASGNAKMYLAAFEVQKGIPAVSLFLNRIVLSADYAAKVKYDCEELFDIKRSDEIAKDVCIDDYRDEVSATLSAELSGNTGAFTAVQFALGLTGFYRPHKDEGKQRAGVRFSMKSLL